MLGPQTVAVDAQNDELIVGDPSGGDILVYPRLANGNVPPKRILRGLKTGLREVVGVAVDTKRNLLIASNRGATRELTGIFMFDRTAEGDTAPLRVIAGSETGIGRSRQIVVDQNLGKIYLGVQNTNYHAERPYVETAPRKDYSWNDRRDAEGRNRNLPSWSGDSDGFVGIWDEMDHGNVAPRGVIKGVLSRIVDCGGVDIDPKEGIVVSADGGQSNMYHVYLVPQFFTESFWDQQTRPAAPSQR